MLGMIQSEKTVRSGRNEKKKNTNGCENHVTEKIKYFETRASKKLQCGERKEKLDDGVFFSLT